ncbi:MULTISPECIES: helix-turn-helix domain-containing protein [unclassified Bradyrhizobium]
MKPTSLAKALDIFRRERGLTQQDLARRLRVSQPHLSRILSESVPVSDKVKSRAMRLLFGKQSSTHKSAWLGKVAGAAKQSTAFRRLVSLALEMLEK